jgi:transposase-like protein
MKRPPFCPRPSCRFHSHPPSSLKWYDEAGHYYTNAFGEVQRFQCKHCGKGFSTQTFSIDYYSKRTIPYKKLLNHLITTSSIRDMARDFSVSTDVIGNKLGRLSRNCIAALQQLQREVRLGESVAADGFESFTVSQFFPCHINLLAGSQTQLVYWFDYVTLRRKGRMTDEQKEERKKIEKLFKADPKGVERSFRRLYDMLSHLICDGLLPSVRLATDEHPAYRRALKKHFSLRALRGMSRFDNIEVSSKRERNHANPLFSVNYVDRQIRKDMAEHVRETVCFGLNVNCALDRMVIYLTYHNLKKPFREVRGDLRTHAEVAGLSERMVRSICYGMLTRRVFLSKIRPEGRYRKMWLREYITPLKKRPEHRPLHIAA